VRVEKTKLTTVESGMILVKNRRLKRFWGNVGFYKTFLNNNVNKLFNSRGVIMKYYFIAFIAVFILLAGCANNPIIQKAKNDQQVNEFFEAYPDAKVTLKEYSAQEIEKLMPEIKTICEKELPVQKYFYMNIEESDLVHLNVFLVEDAENPECVSAKGKFFEEFAELPRPDPEKMLEMQQKQNLVCKDAQILETFSLEGCVADKKAYCDENPGPYPEILESCYESAERDCKLLAESGKSLCLADLGTLRRGILFGPRTDATKQEKIESACPKLYNDELREMCPGIINKYNDYDQWFDEYFINIDEPNIFSKQ